MSNNKKIRNALIIILLLFAIHEITFVLDKNAIEKGNKPSFALNLVRYKDGGSVVYYGLGYQVLRWHEMSIGEMSIEERKIAQEIYRFPFFKNWDDGPKSETQYFDYKP